MTESSAVFSDVPSSLRRRLPISLDGVVAQGPEFVNHGSDYHRWLLVGADGTPVGQVRVYEGRRDDSGRREAVYIPPRGQIEQAHFSLPHAEQFSTYLREQIGTYLNATQDAT